jgi:hypothetical protein
MEQLEKAFDVESLVEKLTNNDPQAEVLIRNFKLHLKSKHPTSQLDQFAKLAAVYEDAGSRSNNEQLLTTAKDLYYSAKRVAEEEGEPMKAQMLMEKVLSLPGEID